MRNVNLLLKRVPLQLACVMETCNNGSTADVTAHLLHRRRRKNEDEIRTRYRRHHSRQCPTEKYTIETAVFVDPMTVKKHEAMSLDQLKDYILGLFNIANLLFDHCATGYNISFSIVRIVFFDSGWPSGLTYTRHSELLLDRFCRWQRTINPHKNHSNHHDYAVLITGEVLSSGNSLQPGRAYVKGMCNDRRSCQVSAESGFQTGFVIAHEAGHGFGMLHDGQPGDNCDGSAGYLMSSFVQGGRHLYIWSSCSLQYIHDFMEERDGSINCLLDSNGDDCNITKSNELLGEKYSLDEQCVFQTGERTSTACLNVVTRGSDMCNSLWCSGANGQCTTLNIPLGDGSPCGGGDDDERICLKGHCRSQAEKTTLFQAPVPIDGRWSNYTQFGPCSRSSGTGVRVRERRCNNPRPSYGGSLCHGSSFQVELCNQQECPSSFDWRKIACALHSDAKGDPLLPHFVKGSCELWCYNRLAKRSLPLIDGSRRRRTIVPDGVSCNVADNEYCYQGNCLKFGCDDHKSPSEIVYDRKCGICGERSDSASCSTVHRAVSAIVTPKSKVKIFQILPGARKIVLYLLKGFLSVSLIIETEEGVRLNSSSPTHRIGVYHRIDGGILGTKLHLFRSPYNHETLEIFGPLRQWLEIWVENPTHETVRVPIQLTYEYPDNCFEIDACLVDGAWTNWQLVTPSCSRTCGGGTRAWKRTCTNPRPGRHGRSCEGPETKVAICNEEPCPCDAVDFFNSQCVKNFDDEPYTAIGHRDGLAKCFVLCTLPGTKKVAFIDAENGTPCNFSSNEKWRCHADKCLNVDREFNGNNAPLRVNISGQYNIGNVLPASYDVVTLPAGTQRFIMNMTVPFGGSHIELRCAESGHLLYTTQSDRNFIMRVDYAFDAEITLFRTQRSMSLSIAGHIPFAITVQICLTVIRPSARYSPNAAYSFFAECSAWEKVRGVKYAWSWERVYSCCGPNGKNLYAPRCYEKSSGKAVCDEACSKSGPRPAPRYEGLCLRPTCTTTTSGSFTICPSLTSTITLSPCPSTSAMTSSILNSATLSPTSSPLLFPSTSSAVPTMTSSGSTTTSSPLPSTSAMTSSILDSATLSPTSSPLLFPSTSSAAPTMTYFTKYPSLTSTTALSSLSPSTSAASTMTSSTTPSPTPTTPMCPRFRWSFRANRCRAACGESGYRRYSAICTDECTGQKRGKAKCDPALRPEGYREECSADPCSRR
ncbi:A disintegrin and metalloproteinase with thrombospondin motifs 14-like isoform X2 [Oscarella lobularis]|uniref:A disintegrin and metalloproteinase with thrombospondin motifs 14-like isoform X2 n=1 Tax=Oscarella lobularis TaxID=121494 RepID=UPI003313D607